MNVPEIIKLIQESKELLKNIELRKSDDVFKKSIEGQINRLIAMIPDKMPHPKNNNYFGHKNGDMYSEYTNKMAGSNPTKTGYIRNQFGDKKILRHRLIYECFHNVTLKPEDQIDHINSEKNDNTIWNLQKLTAVEHGKKTHGGKKGTHGAKQSKAVRRFKLDKNGKRYDVKDYVSITSAVKDVKCSQGHISNVLSGKRKTSAKYYWEHVEIAEDDKFIDEDWKKLCEVDKNIFKDVKSEISDFGRIKSGRGVITYGCLASSGYATTWVNGVQYYVHTLVCWAFHGKKPSEKHSVDHKNKIKNDNTKENLRWCTPEEQADNNNAIPISVWKDGKFIGKYKSQEFAARKLDLQSSNISKCICGEKTHHKGYTFKKV